MLWHAPAHAATHRAALVIQHSSSWPGPRVLWKCVEFAQEAIGGLALLELAGVNSGQPPQVYDWGGGAYTVCQVDRQPIQVPDKCFAKSMSEPNWSDSYARNGAWTQRPVGVSGYSVSDGDMEGWTYSVGMGTLPPTVSFSQVCPAPRTTPTAKPPASQAGTTTSVAPTSTVTPLPELQARAPSVSPTAGAALASTGPAKPPPPAGLGPWVLFAGAVILLSGLLAFNLRRRGP